MSYSRISNSVLLLLCCGSCLPAAGQRTAVSPLTPRLPLAKPNNPAHQPITKSFPATKPDTISRRVPTPQTRPLYILNSAVIMVDLEISPAEIKKIVVYKSGRDVPYAWRNLTAYGIISITLKEKAALKSRSFEEIGAMLGVRGPVTYTVNGMSVEGTNLRIAPEAIGEIKVNRAPGTASGTTVAIRLAPPKPSPPRPPGTVLIRGTAGI